MAEKKKRATLGELKQFADKVRAAGGGNPIDALIPAVPEDISQCLIARNLNFNCSVGGWRPSSMEEHWDNPGAWWMSVDSEELARKIGKALRLQVAYNESELQKWGIKLPRRIAAVAEAFDTWAEAASAYEEGLSYTTPKQAWRDLSREDKKMLRDFTPYIDASILEAHNLASIVNEDGSIVV